MKTFKFEITLTDDMLCGDEFWEDALKADGTGITVLTEAVVDAILSANIVNMMDPPMNEIVKLIEYNEK
jgi:hypothetical protein